MRGTVVAVVAALLLAGCGLGAAATKADGPVHVDGPLVVSGTEPDAWFQAGVQGGLTYDDGCLLLAGLPVIWPYGTTWDEDGERVVLADGRTVDIGDGLDGGGGYLDQSQQSSFGYDERQAERVVRRCFRWGATEVIALSPEVVRIRRGDGGSNPLAPPTSLRTEEGQPRLPTARAISGVWRDRARPELGRIAFGRSAAPHCVERFRRGRPVTGGFFPLIPARRHGCGESRPWSDYLAQRLRRGWVVGDRLHLFGDDDRPLAVLERVG